ncbi:MAG: rod shape-determining protein MreC [Proteobacteria bacterium]|nr:rod shape-determining protein MreC [Pseudomonadota bacterium]
MQELLKRYQTVAVILGCLTLPLLLLIFGKGNRQQPFAAERPVVTAIGKIQNKNDYLVGNAANFWENYIDLVHTRRENAALRQENARLREENIGLQGILQQNARLTRLVGFKQSHPLYQLEPARVIAADISPFFRVLRIRIEAQTDDIRPEMPVVSAEGVVGRIEKVNGRFCDVMLTVDPRSKIDILTQMNRSRGILTGTGDDRRYEARIAYLLRRDEVEEGEIVVTSGRAGMFPKELPVGRITAIDTKSFGLYQTVTVEPLVDFSRLEEVYIITGIYDTAPPAK